MSIDQTTNQWTLVGTDGDVEGSSSACTTSTTSSEGSELFDVTGSLTDTTQEIMSMSCDNGEVTTDLSTADSSGRVVDRTLFILHTRRISEDSSDSDSDYVRLTGSSSDELSEHEPSPTDMVDDHHQQPSHLTSSVSDSFRFLSDHPDSDSVTCHPCQPGVTVTSIHTEEPLSPTGAAPLSDADGGSPDSMDNASAAADLPDDFTTQQRPRTDCNTVTSPDDDTAIADTQTSSPTVETIDCFETQDISDSENTQLPVNIESNQSHQPQESPDVVDTSTPLDIFRQLMFWLFACEVYWQRVVIPMFFVVVLSTVCLSTILITKSFSGSSHATELANVSASLQTCHAAYQQSQSAMEESLRNIKTLKSEILKLKQKNVRQTSLMEQQVESVKRLYASRVAASKVNRDSTEKQLKDLLEENHRLKDLLEEKHRLKDLLEENHRLKDEIKQLEYLQQSGNEPVLLPVHPQYYRQAHPHSYTDDDHNETTSGHRGDVVYEALKKEVEMQHRSANLWQSRYIAEKHRRIEIEQNYTRSLNSCLSILNTTFLGLLPNINASVLYNYVTNVTKLFNVTDFDNFTEFVKTKWGNFVDFTESSKPFVYEHLNNLWSYASVVVSHFVKEKEDSHNEAPVKSNPRENFKQHATHRENFNGEEKDSHSDDVGNKDTKDFRKKRGTVNMFETENGRYSEAVYGDRESTPKGWRRLDKVIGYTRNAVRGMKKQIQNAWSSIQSTTKDLWHQHKDKIKDLRDRVIKKSRDFERRFSDGYHAAAKSKAHVKQRDGYLTLRSQLQKIVTGYSAKRFKSASLMDVSTVLDRFDEINEQFKAEASRDPWVHCQTLWWKYKVDSEKFRKASCWNYVSDWQRKVDGHVEVKRARTYGRPHDKDQVEEDSVNGEWYFKKKRSSKDEGSEDYEDGDKIRKTDSDNDDNGDASWYFKNKRVYTDDDRKDGSWYFRKTGDAGDYGANFRQRDQGEVKDGSWYFRQRDQDEVKDGSWYFRQRDQGEVKDGSWYFQPKSKEAFLNLNHESNEQFPGKCDICDVSDEESIERSGGDTNCCP